MSRRSSPPTTSGRREGAPHDPKLFPNRGGARLTAAATRLFRPVFARSRCVLMNSINTHERDRFQEVEHDLRHRARADSRTERPEMAAWPVHGRIDGPIVMIGFGSIGRGTLPLIERHFDVRQEPHHRHRSGRQGPRAPRRARRPLRAAGGDARELPRAARRRCSPRAAARASASTSRSTRPRVDIMELCRELGALYIDTVVEPWAGFYFDKQQGPGARAPTTPCAR